MGHRDAAPARPRKPPQSRAESSKWKCLSAASADLFASVSANGPLRLGAGGAHLADFGLFPAAAGASTAGYAEFLPRRLVLLRILESLISIGGSVLGFIRAPSPVVGAHVQAPTRGAFQGSAACFRGTTPAADHRLASVCTRGLMTPGAGLRDAAQTLHGGSWPSWCRVNADYLGRGGESSRFASISCRVLQPVHSAHWSSSQQGQVTR